MTTDSERREVARRLRETELMRLSDETKRPAGERGPFLTYRRKQVRA